MMRFAGKTAVVTGAASGIGKATCLKLAAEGATVIAADIDEAGGSELAATSNGKIIFKRTDVCNVDEIKALMDFAAEKTGGIDIVFNNAGAGGASGDIDEIDAAGWDRTMDLLLRSVAMGIRYAVPHMIGREGRIDHQYGQRRRAFCGHVADGLCGRQGWRDPPVQRWRLPNLRDMTSASTRSAPASSRPTSLRHSA
jgi:NAD(P)-dependent dehydrogenase (short-subunit alcohol dehydrogenase family)